MSWVRVPLVTQKRFQNNEISFFVCITIIRLYKILVSADIYGLAITYFLDVGDDGCDIQYILSLADIFSMA